MLGETVEKWLIIIIIIKIVHEVQKDIIRQKKGQNNPGAVRRNVWRAYAPQVGDYGKDFFSIYTTKS